MMDEQEIRALVNQVLTARRWASTPLLARLKTRPDGRVVVPQLITALARGGGFSIAVSRLLTQLPHLMREALSPEPSHAWSVLVGRNTRLVQEEIEMFLTALTEAATGRAKLTRTFEIAALELQDQAARLEQEQATQSARFAQVQSAHRQIVRELQGNRFGWLAFLLRLFRGDAFARLVETSNEREMLALDLDLHQAAIALLHQAADAARRKGIQLTAKAEALARAEQAARAELATLELRLHSKAPFLAQNTENWTVMQEWSKTHPDGDAPQHLVASLADTSIAAAAHLDAIQTLAQGMAARQLQGLNIQSAIEAEARHLGIPTDDPENHPLLLVGEALLGACLETHPRFWLSPLAHPREFLFQVAPDSTAPFDLADTHTAKFENGAPVAALTTSVSAVEGPALSAVEGLVGFVHVQLGLARQDLDAYTKTREAFLAAQNDHNLLIIEDLARQWNRRWRYRQRVGRIGRGPTRTNADKKERNK